MAIAVAEIRNDCADFFLFVRLADDEFFERSGQCADAAALAFRCDSAKQVEKLIGVNESL